MAVLDSIPGVRVNVCVGGQEVREWRNIDEDEDTYDKTVRYVEAASGHAFTVAVSVEPSTRFVRDMLRFYLIADGQFVACHGLHPAKYGTQTRVFRGSQDGDILHKFRFSKLETVEDEISFNGEPNHLEGIGELEVQLYHMTEMPCEHGRPEPSRMFSSARDRAYQRIEPFNNVGAISKKDLKGRSVTHSIRFDDNWVADENLFKGDRAYQHRSDAFTGHGLRAGAPATSSNDRAARTFVKGPRAGTFVFRYRSNEALRSMLIVPRSPSDPPRFPSVPRFGEVNQGGEQQIAMRGIDLGRAQHVEPTQLDQGDQPDIYKKDGKPNRSVEIEVRGASGVKREREEDVAMEADSNPRPRKLHKPTADSVVFELGDDDLFHQIFPCGTPQPKRQMDVIDLDDVL